MKNKMLLTLSWSLLAGIVALQATPLTVAVYDFRGDGTAASYGNDVSTLVTADLTTETNLVMVERSELNKALNEQAFGISGLVSADAAAKIGQITGAKVLVTGQIIKTSGSHLVIVATIIGTESGRLFADKVEGSTDSLMDLTSDLSHKIAQTITAHATNFITAAGESHAELLARITTNLKGTNRPSVSVNIHLPRGGRSATCEGEFGAILLKAGFKVVDARSDRKPDVEISGVIDLSRAHRNNELFSYRAVIELKVQDRRSGSIITFDRQESIATDAAKVGADRTSQVNAVDALAERVLPFLAQQPTTNY